MSVAQEREKTIDAVRWVVVLLAVVTAWEAARTINEVVYRMDLIGGGKVFNKLVAPLAPVEAAEAPAFTAQVSQFFTANADLIVTTFFALAMVALVARMLFACPLLDYLYLESAARDRRTMIGFLFVTLGLILQMGLLYAMVAFGRVSLSHPQSGLVPMLLVVYMLGGAVWLLLMRLGAKRDDAHGIRGIWAAFGVNLIVGCLLAAAVWLMAKSADDPATFHQDRLNNLSLAATAGLLACSFDTFLQGRLYGKKGEGAGWRTAFMLVVLLGLLAAGGFLIYKTAPPIEF